MDIFQQKSMLYRWLCSESHFKATPFMREMHKKLQEPDEEKLTAEIESHGGIDALEIKIYGAPLSFLLGCGYAPGQYMGKCPNCLATFFGDKRSITCLTCAVNTYATVSCH